MFLLLLLLLTASAAAEAAKIRIKVESPGGIEQNVYLTRPVQLAADRPIVFVMHGDERNAQQCRDQWHALAIEHDFLLVVPEFSARQFPGPEAYQLGNVFDATGMVRPKIAWSFSAIEPIFDEVRRRFAMTTRGYAMYGHSTGAQFVQRFLLHIPQARVTRAVAANAGWYTMPVFNVEFPYGLRNSVVHSADLAAALQLPVIVLLGEADSDPDDPKLRRTPEALAQGPNRLTRGLLFFDTAADASAQLGVRFAWQLVTVPGVGHESGLMAPAALPWLLEESGQRQPETKVPASQPSPEALPDELPVTGM